MSEKECRRAETDARREAAERELGDRIAALEAKKADQRDPDGIYQLGRMVAKVVFREVHLNQGVIVFHRLDDAHDLNQNAEYEYREYRLVTARQGEGGGIQIGNQKPAVTLENLVSRIVGLRP